ncbi:hypothetical protein PFISCL1PPCAC_28654, partial [Pristionchus fissidentatus]
SLTLSLSHCSPPLVPLVSPSLPSSLQSQSIQLYFFSMEDSELGQDQRALVHSISHARLGEIVKKWHCDALCRGAWTTHGGFGMVADKFWPPRVLPCGHYMCNKCWRKKEKKKKKSHECGDCLRTTSHVEIENAPVPMHIQNFIAFFRDWGMRCDYCSKRQDGVNEQRKPALTVRSRDARVRYPPELIHSYFDINAAEKFTIPPDLGPDPPVSLKKKKNTKHIEEEVAPNRLLLCTFCVLSHDSSLDKRFFSVAQISKPVGDPPRSLTRDIRDLAVKKVFTSKHFKYCKPWYIWMLSPRSNDAISGRNACLPVRKRVHDRQPTADFRVWSHGLRGL